MTVLRHTLLALLMGAAPALATPSGLVETYASCAGRLEAAYAPTAERDAMETLLTAAMPAALDWGMPARHAAEVRMTARVDQVVLQHNALFSSEARLRASAEDAARTALAQCRQLLPSDLTATELAPSTSNG